MTGYAYREYQDEQFQVTLEVKSYNNRYLDISVHLPGILSPLEPEFRERVRSVVSRGHVDVSIRYRSLESEVLVHVDHRAVEQYRRAFREIIDLSGCSGDAVLSDYLSIDEILKPIPPQGGTAHGTELLELFEQLLSEFQETRLKEGEATRRNVMIQLEEFLKAFSLVRSRADVLEKSLKDTLKTRFEQLLGSGYDENRILSEVAVLLVKYSIQEEISRVESHLEQFHNMIHEAGVVGKKLDFLCQELNREVNTIASKSTMAEVNQAVVTMKDHLENIREQLRNVE